MPYVERDAGVIVGRYAVAQPGRAEEFLSDSDPEILALELATAKDEKRDAFIAEGVTRITASVPEWNDFERIALLASVWNMLDGASATAAQDLAKDIYLYVKITALPKLAPLTLTQLQLVDPSAADPFGDGTPWPT